MNTLLLFSLPWGYLIAALFLLVAIILFIIAIFMKDTGTHEEGELEDDRYGQQEEAYENASYEDTFDRYQNVTDADDTEDTLQDMIADTSENLAETRMFTPIVDIPEPEPFEESTEVEAVAEEEVPEEVFTAPVISFADFAEPEEVADDVEEVAEEAAEAEPEEIVEKVPEAEPVKKARAVAPVDEDEFEEIRPRKKRFYREEEDEMEVPKPVAKQKSGMSFAEEVRRLIEEEEKKKR